MCPKDSLDCLFYELAKNTRDFSHEWFNLPPLYGVKEKVFGPVLLMRLVPLLLSRCDVSVQVKMLHNQTSLRNEYQLLNRLTLLFSQQYLLRSIIPPHIHDFDNSLHNILFESDRKSTRLNSSHVAI